MSQVSIEKVNEEIKKAAQKIANNGFNKVSEEEIENYIRASVWDWVSDGYLVTTLGAELEKKFNLTGKEFPV